MQPDDPEALKVQWLEDSLLVHAVTLEAAAPGDSHRWLFGAVLSGALAALAVAAGWPGPAVVPALAWAGCAAVLARRSWQASRRVLPSPRRLLVELQPERVAWTLLTGERWSMRHDHDHPIDTLLTAVPVTTAPGPAVRMVLRTGETIEIPLYGLPFGDARWLADRIGDLLVAPTE